MNTLYVSDCVNCQIFDSSVTYSILYTDVIFSTVFCNTDCLYYLSLRAKEKFRLHKAPDEVHILYLKFLDVTGKSKRF